ncbi:MAG: 50S ribosomal protein L24 [Candidatus Taylorbacteria bacterium RIFCSPLOWO2_12_FULL_43_20]|uniref:Large ribosomal subunit protein uL24 n=1 Tax=Candidatus Taylorbacteria bacterium RIFCSPLOWO2_12_FULL_43_20 TaxID=1802332 RepID=A0A1G2P436_9BACT|nr:MAG: 50S ribosomal protein L24 [Candidatus Taylorbacteria bacterium RIFCSPHIGHO2_01_FULL_43_120]OHA23456.1 MAG: 50S ribosomal protein L24 [Candidatus Taylorbacteria bacterium RIFCSPHIGHO2_02_FULL_43_55]OHA29661.1 MAG: 50S ribosomal protein L24 [Candidatus Taylorbacteria bacterium RIFCSPHIGHO2_12_FULL_42_34]OHA31589.1 MAG: 50S ribosomal protein L24 [Candidatus Taylorbacteria bacterium RIFCSPLOWO2_01_FULL_43_83]OHA38970.1 MAG: 50S ribosomal protein L24 [Candidatus Taylorbacteria bacterium RIFC
MKIKKNDKVVVITGKDKGKIGKVTRAFPSTDMVLVDGVNKKKKHAKSKKSGKKGEILDIFYPVHVSNVKIIDPETEKGVRIAKKLVDGKFVRVSAKSGKELG